MARFCRGPAGVKKTESGALPMRWPALFFLLAIGLPLCYMGWVIWKKEKIQLIHDYHTKRVTKKDQRAYAALMGKALLLIGAGTALTGVIDFLTVTPNGWPVFFACFCAGLIMILRAQKKHNGGLF